MQQSMSYNSKIDATTVAHVDVKTILQIQANGKGMKATKLELVGVLTIMCNCNLIASR